MRRAAPGIELETWSVDGIRISEIRRTHCKNDHEFTPENTKRDANGNRVCRACRKDIEARHTAKRRAQRKAKGEAA